MTLESSFHHLFVPARAGDTTPLLLLHGTGGDEHDLIPLGERLAPGAALLSPRGPVLENGMPRFFRRLREGIFDLDDITRRARDLTAFVRAKRHEHGLAAPIAVGFSNGANIAAAMMLADPGAVSGAILLRAMHPYNGRKVDPKPDLKGLPVLILSGASDPIVPAGERESLVSLFRDAGASVSAEVLPGGHGLTGLDLSMAQRWLGTLRSAKSAAA